MGAVCLFLKKSIFFIFFISPWQLLSPAISNQCGQTPVQWITLTNKTVISDMPRERTGRDSSATTLLLLFLLSLSSSAPRSHSHSSLPDPAATTQNPWDSPDHTLFPPGHQSCTRLQSPCDGGANFLPLL